LAASHRLPWFGTARSRLGILVTPSTLLYGTADVAYAKSDYNLNLFGAPAAAVNFKDVITMRCLDDGGEGLKHKRRCGYRKELK
jgi:hypothetical protein